MKTLFLSLLVSLGSRATMHFDEATKKWYSDSPENTLSIEDVHTLAQMYFLSCKLLQDDPVNGSAACYVLLTAFNTKPAKSIFKELMNLPDDTLTQVIDSYIV